VRRTGNWRRSFLDDNQAERRRQDRENFPEAGPYGIFLLAQGRSTRVEKLLAGRQPADAAVALTDVYTGTRDFIDAADAKAKMRDWVGENNFLYPTQLTYLSRLAHNLCI
jgi:hypothetical protein